MPGATAREDDDRVFPAHSPGRATLLLLKRPMRGALTFAPGDSITLQLDRGQPTIAEVVQQFHRFPGLQGSSPSRIRGAAGTPAGAFPTATEVSVREIRPPIAIPG